jgi:hypothetical protein
LAESSADAHTANWIGGPRGLPRRVRDRTRERGGRIHFTDACAEVGLKADFRNGRAQATAAYFDISRDDVLERFAPDSTTNIGGIDSRGVELAGTVQVGQRTRFGGNLAITGASDRGLRRCSS